MYYSFDSFKAAKKRPVVPAETGEPRDHILKLYNCAADSCAQHAGTFNDIDIIASLATLVGESICLQAAYERRDVEAILFGLHIGMPETGSVFWQLANNTRTACLDPFGTIKNTYKSQKTICHKESGVKVDAKDISRLLNVAVVSICQRSRLKPTYLTTGTLSFGINVSEQKHDHALRLATDTILQTVKHNTPRPLLRHAIQ